MAFTSSFFLFFNISLEDFLLPLAMPLGRENDVKKIIGCYRVKSEKGKLFISITGYIVIAGWI